MQSNLPNHTQTCNGLSGPDYLYSDSGQPVLGASLESEARLDGVGQVLMVSQTCVDKLDLIIDSSQPTCTMSGFDSRYILAGLTPSLPNSNSTEKQNTATSCCRPMYFGYAAGVYSQPVDTRRRLMRCGRQVFGEPVCGKAVRFNAGTGKVENSADSLGREGFDSQSANLVGSNPTTSPYFSLPHESSKGHGPLPLTATPSGLRGFYSEKARL